MANDFLLTPETVSEGHPAKVTHHISDAVLDAIFVQDPRIRVAAEALTNTGLVVLTGEITINTHVGYIQAARDTIKRMRSKGIINMLDPLRPVYSKTAAYSHFGREEPEFSWESTDKAQTLRAAAGLG